MAAVVRISDAMALGMYTVRCRTAVAARSKLCTSSKSSSDPLVRVQRPVSWETPLEVADPAAW